MNVRFFTWQKEGGEDNSGASPRGSEINFLADIKLNEQVLLRDILAILHNAANRSDGSVLRFGSPRLFAGPAPD